nr:DUF4192 family protein [Microbacterium bovistercoris]
MTDAPKILSSTTGADFLATLPTLTGFTVNDSILIVPFHGKRTMGVMRVDLPPDDDRRQHDKISALALAALSRLSGCDGVVFAVYADQTFPVAFARWEGLISALERRCEDAGFTVKDAFCVAADGWASWYEQDPAFDGHPPAEIDRSPLAEQAARVRGGRELPAQGQAAQLPPADPWLAEALPEAVDDLEFGGRERDAFGGYRPAAPLDAIALIERVLAREPEDVPLPDLARLAVLSVTAARRDEMTVQIAFGRKAGRRLRADSDRLHALMRRTGKSMDELVAAEMPHARGTALGELGGLFTGESRREPKVKRVRRAIVLLGRIAVHLTPDQRPDLLCMLSWLHWALGSASAAAHHAESALRVAPDHRMARTLLAMFSSGRLPEWVYAHHGVPTPATDAFADELAEAMARP